MIGLAVAVLIDADADPGGILLRRRMKLLGDRNWWLPSPLDWLRESKPRARSEIAAES